VTLALEPMHTTYSEEWTLLNDLDRAARVVDDYDSPYLKLAIDMYHVEYDAQSPAMSPNFVNRVAIVQLADRRTAPSADQDRCPLGEGVVPLGEIVSSLIAGGYRGDFDIELIGCDVERDNYVTLIEQSRAFASKLLADAQTPCEVRSSALL
jgi:sugar phosphate isomerase/epimerase